MQLATAIHACLNEANFHLGVLMGWSHANSNTLYHMPCAFTQHAPHNYKCVHLCMHAKCAHIAIAS